VGDIAFWTGQCDVLSPEVKTDNNASKALLLLFDWRVRGTNDTKVLVQKEERRWQSAYPFSPLSLKIIPKSYWRSQNRQEPYSQPDNGHRH
jgi:hypothetical protein